MTKEKFSKDQLLTMPDAVAILKCYFVRGMKKGLTFSDFRDILENNYYLLQQKSIDWTNLKQTLKNRLNQLADVDLIRKEKQNSHYIYYLNSKWFNLPANLLVESVIEKVSPENIVPSLDFGIDENPEYPNDIFVFYGLKEKHPKIKEHLDALTKIVSETFMTKYRNMNIVCEKTLDAFAETLDIAEKTKFSIEKLGGYGKLLHLSISTINASLGDIPSKDDVKKQCSLIGYPQDFFVDAVCTLNKEIIRFYPFGVGLFAFLPVSSSYMDLMGEDFDLKILSHADSPSETPEEYYTAKIQECEKAEQTLKEVLGDRKPDKTTAEMTKKIQGRKRKFESLREKCLERMN